ncbi:MAG: hypothetical protein KTR31_03400 [Myxococcales bacterium]|nr:hypothetical protein [Myxococcales bacterium]
MNPSAKEIGCDGRDNDCEPSTVDGPAVTATRTWSSVQAALNSAAPGEEIRLCGSEIDEALHIDKELRLVGAGASKTSLSGESSSDSVLRISAPAHVEGLTIEDGVASYGAGVHIDVSPWESVTLHDVAIRDNVAVADGGGIWIARGQVVLSQVQLEGNRAVRGGGIWADTSASLPLELRDASLSGNRATDGGALWLTGTARLTRSSIAENFAAQGGGIWMAGELTGDELSTVADNLAQFGAGVWGTGTLAHLTIAGNAAYSGGGIRTGGPLQVTDVVIQGNTAAPGIGGGVWADHPLEMSATWLVDNVSEQTGGGLHASAETTLTDVTVSGNEADQGAGVAAFADTHINKGTFELNRASREGGALLQACGAQSLLIDSSTLFGNHATTGPALALADGHATLLGTQVLVNEASQANGAAIELSTTGCAPAQFDALSDTSFAQNAPHDLGVGPLRQPAEDGPFQCTLEGTAAQCSRQ